MIGNSFSFMGMRLNLGKKKLSVKIHSTLFSIVNVFTNNNRELHMRNTWSKNVYPSIRVSISQFLASKRTEEVIRSTTKFNFFYTLQYFILYLLISKRTRGAKMCYYDISNTQLVYNRNFKFSKSLEHVIHDIFFQPKLYSLL